MNSVRSVSLHNRYSDVCSHESCPFRIHILSGCRTDALSRSAMEKVYLENLQFSVRRLEQVGIRRR